MIKNSAPIDTVLNEFVYTALFKADYEKKRGLRGKFLKAAVSEKAARLFCAKSTREEKEIVLAHLGYEFYYVINKSGEAFSQLKPFLHTLPSKKSVSRAIAEDGVVMVSDRDTLRILGLISRTAHHPSFYLDLEMVRQGYHITKWKKRYGGENEYAYREADESARLVCKMLLACMLVTENSLFSIGCTKNELCLLVYLYVMDKTEITTEEMKDFFYGRFTTASKFSYAFKGLMKSSLVGKLNGRVYITGVGIKKVNSFFKTIIHSNNF